MNKAIVAIGVLFLAIQLVPVDRTNPPETGRVPAPEAVAAVLERSCFDCHSNNTRWPWYAYVAPVSWLVAYDVHEAREHMNFSEWDRLSAEKRAKKIHEVWEEVEEGEMPLWYYLPLHEDARLVPQDLTALRTWAEAEGAESDDAGSEDSDSHEH